MIFDQIPKLCLTLPERPERRSAAERHFYDSGMLNVRFISAINGAEFGLRTIFPYTLDDARDRPNNPGTFFCGHHETGIFLSHYMAWTVVLHSGAEFTAIMEDDCKLLPGWKERLNKALSDCPSFDWMFCGHCCAQGRQARRIVGEVFDVQYPSCFHFYIISKRGAAILIETQRKVWGPIDVTVFMQDPNGGSKTAFHRMRVVTILPRVAEQFNTELAP